MLSMTILLRSPAGCQRLRDGLELRLLPRSLNSRRGMQPVMTRCTMAQSFAVLQTRRRNALSVSGLDDCNGLITERPQKRRVAASPRIAGTRPSDWKIIAP